MIIEFDKISEKLARPFARFVRIFLREYFRLIVEILGLERSPAITRIINFIDEPMETIDERIAKIDVARSNLIDSLTAIDELKNAAEYNKAELERAVIQISKLEKERSIAQDELYNIKAIARADTSILKKVIGIPTPSQVWRERVYGFVSGIVASLIASVLWVVIGKIL